MFFIQLTGHRKTNGFTRYFHNDVIISVWPKKSFFHTSVNKVICIFIPFLMLVLKISLHALVFLHFVKIQRRYL